MIEGSTLSATQIASLNEVDAEDWNRLAGQNPLLKHEFLLAMESAGCVGSDTAWEPCHLLLKDPGNRLVGALPLYFKHDSRGEFVFDWAWADAYERAGLDYYPKLVSAVPFTPATGHRLLVDPEAGPERVRRQLADEAIRIADEANISSLHVLFPVESDRATFRDAGLLERKGCQFHWRNDAYRNFDEFLGRFSSAKRKKAKRERRRIAEAGIQFDHLKGNELSQAEWDAVYDFCANTFFRRGHAPYLNREFFDIVSRQIPENVLVILARFDGQPIAAAICFCGGGSLYGRYWGSVADFHSLHFETCYYQGIDYCIGHELQCFEPGTQGEHKISRGFTPTPTWSFHWLKEPGFYDAIQDYLTRETSHVDSYMEHWDEHLPYRQDASRQNDGA
jgi:predicted N-acyltransferase